MREIDEKVVEMRFDNKDFEKNTKESLGTLEKLKSALNFEGAGKSLEALEKTASNVKLSGIASAVESLQDRFSTFGIIGMRVIENLTDAMMNTLGSAISTVTDKIISGGWKRAMNIENAHFQLQSLLKDEIKVQSIMDSAMNSVDGTAYAYDEAAKAASMFAASGIESGKEMDEALGAIANATAAVNGNYESMAQLMTKIAGQGRIMGGELLQLSGQGMNAAAMIAKYYKEVLGYTDMDEAGIRKRISDKDTDVTFKEVVDALNYAYDGAAKRANETFNGALANIGAAFARIGQKFFSPLIEQNGVLVDLFNAIRIKINEINKAVTPFADTFVKVSKTVAKSLTDKIITPVDKFSNTLRDLSKFSSDKNGLLNLLSISLRDQYEQMGENSDQVQILEEDYGSLYNAFKKGAISSDQITKAIKNMNNPLDRVIKTAKGLQLKSTGDEVSYLRVALEHLGYDTKSSTGAFNEFTEGVADAVKEFQKAHNITASGVIDEKTFELLEKAINATKLSSEELENLNRLLGVETPESISTLTNFIKALNEDGWEQMGKKLKEAGGSLTDFENILRLVLNNKDIDPDQLIKTYGSLNEAFKAGKISADDLREALERYKSADIIADKNLKYKIGDVHTNIKMLQENLKDAGLYAGEFSNTFTKSTEEAVREAQKLAGIKVTGIVDEETWNAINKLAGYTHELNLNVDDLMNTLEKKSGKQLITDTILNGFKAIIAFIKPIKEAFNEVFPAKSVENIHDVLEAIERFSEKLIISEKNAQNLKDGFKGFLNVIKLVVDTIFNFIAAIKGSTGEISTLDYSIFDLIGLIGRLLTGFTDWARSSEKLGNVFKFLVDKVKIIIDYFIKLKDNIVLFFESFKNSGKAQKLLSDFNIIFEKLVNKTGPKITGLITKIKNFKNTVKDIIPKSTTSGLSGFINSINKVSDVTNKFSLSNVVDSFKSFFKVSDDVNAVTYEKAMKSMYALQDVTKVTVHTLSLDENGNVIEDFGNEVNEKLTFKEAINNFGILIGTITFFKEKLKGLKNIPTFIGKIKDTLVNFAHNVKEKVLPFINSIDFGNIVSIVTAAFLIKAIISIASAFKNLTKSLRDLTKSFKMSVSSIKDVAKAYSKDLKADAFIKLAAAIAILAGSMFLLSFVDTKKIGVTFLAILGLIATVVGAIAIIEKINSKKSKKALQGIDYFFSGLDSLFTEYGKSKKWNALSKAVKTMMTAILAIAGSIIAIGLFYTHGGKEAFKAGSALVIAIALSITAYVTIMGAISQALDRGISSFNKAMIGVLLLSASLMVCITALKKLFKIDLPLDYKRKLWILAGIAAGLAVLTLAIGAASRIMGKDGGTLKMGGTVLALSLMLFTIVSSLNKLFKMKIPEDYGKKLGILGGIFAALVVLVAVIGVVSSKGKGVLKAGGTILALCVMIGTIIAALMVLSFVPAERLLKGARGLALVLFAVGGALWAAAQITKGKGTLSGISALAIIIGELIVGLLILSIVDWTKLWHAAVSLDGVLVALGIALAGAGQIENSKNIGTLILGVLALGGLVTALWFLSNKVQDSEKLLQVCEGLSLIIVAIGTSLLLIAKMDLMSLGDVGKVILLMSASLVECLVLVGIMNLLNVLSLDTMIFGAISLGILLNAIASSIVILSKIDNVDFNTIKANAALMIVSLLECVALAYTMHILDGLSWDTMIFGAISLGILLNAIALSMVVISKTSVNDIKDVGSIAVMMLTGVVACLGLALVMNEISKLPIESMIPSALALGLLMIELAAAMDIVALGGKLGIKAALIGVAGLTVFVVAMSLLMACLGNLMSQNGCKEVMEKGVEFFGLIGQAIGALVGGVVAGFTGFAAAGLGPIADALSYFAHVATPFFEMLNNNITLNTALGAALMGVVIAELTGDAVLAGFTTLMTFGVGFANMGFQLSSFAIAALPFFTTMSMLKDDVATKTQNMADAIKVLTDAAFINGVSNFMSKFIGGKTSLVDLGKQLLAFGMAIVPYSILIQKGVTEESVKASENAGKMIKSLTENLPDQNGLVELLLTGGQKNLVQVAMQMLAAAIPLTEYAKLVEGKITDASVEASKNAGLIIGALFENMPRNNGIFDWIIGTKKSLKRIGEEIVPFADYVVEYSNKLAGQISPQSVEVSKAATEMVAALLTSLPDKSSVKGFFFGGNKSDIYDMGDQLVKFGDVVNQYYSKIKSISPSSFNAVTESLRQFLEFAKMCNDVSMAGLKNLKDAMDTFGDTLVDAIVSKLQNSGVKIDTGVGTFTDNAAKSFDNNKSKFSGTGDTYVNEILNSFTGTDVNASISKISDTFSSNISGKNGLLSNNNLKNLDTVMPEYIKEMGISIDGNDSIKELNDMSSKIATEITGDNGLTSSENLSLFDDSAFKGINAYTNGLIDNESMAEITNSSNKIMEQLTNELGSSSNMQMIDTESFDIIKQFSGGLSETKSLTEVKNNTNTVNTTFIDKISETEDEAYKVGQNATQGFINGVSSREKENGLKEAASKLASTFLDKLKSKLDEHSPSKETEGIGDFATMGLINGLLKKVAEVAEAGKDLGSAVIEGANNGIKTISEIFEDSLNEEDLVLRPTVDISDVTKSADDISKLFNNAILETSLAAHSANSSFEKQKYPNGYFENSKSDETKNTDTLNQYNTFNITGSDPKETAEEVSRILQQQVERRKASWA